MRNELAVMDTTKNRRARLQEQREEIAALRRIVKGLCLYVGGVATILAVIACGAEMYTEAAVTGVIAFGATLYGVL